MSSRDRKERFGRLFEFPYFDNYLELALVEYEYARLHECDHVLFVGGGPLPLTAVAYVLLDFARRRGLLPTLARHLSEADGPKRFAALRQIVPTLAPPADEPALRVTSWDVDEEAVRRSRALLRSLDLAEHIDVTRTDGADGQLTGSEGAIMVASMAEPKQAILANVLDQIAPARNVCVVVRSVERGNLRQILYRPLEQNLIDELQLAFPRFRRESSFAPPGGSRLVNSFETFRVHPVCKQPGLRTRSLS